MAKIGISVKIDVSKIDKTRIFQGKNGAKYLDLTTFINTDEPDQYDNHGFICQSTTKEEREQGLKTPILGNTRVFYTDLEKPQPQAPVAKPDFSMGGDPSDDTPFAPVSFIG